MLPSARGVKLLFKLSLCGNVQRSSLSDVIKLVPGVAKCPYDPRQNNTYLMTADGTLYTATVTDFTGRDAAIYRSLGSQRPLRTVQYNSRWLNGNYK